MSANKERINKASNGSLRLAMKNALKNSNFLLLLMCNVKLYPKEMSGSRVLNPDQ